MTDASKISFMRRAALAVHMHYYNGEADATSCRKYHVSKSLIDVLTDIITWLS